MATALAIRHMYSDSLFTLEKPLLDRGLEVTTIDSFATDYSQIDALAPDIVIIMGGAMGVYEADRFPYLTDEIALIKKRIAADKPLLGVCLGAQLIAAAAGKKVYKGEHGKEYGFMPLILTDEGKNSPLRHFAPDKTSVLQMHGDTFDLPDGAVLLAKTDKYPQGYRLGNNIYAVQFHPEFDEPSLENTLAECASSMDTIAFRTAGKQYLATMEKQNHAFMNDLLDSWKL